MQPFGKTARAALGVLWLLPALLGVEECGPAQDPPIEAGNTGGADSGTTTTGGGGGTASSGDSGATSGTPGEGHVCGGILGASCEKAEFCNYGTDAGGDGCDVADGQGVCQVRPQACTLEYAPVCGCDGKTYSNACAAQAAGASVDHTGECASGAGEACGEVTCPAGRQCCDSLCGTCVEPGQSCVLGCPDPKPGTTCGGIASLACQEGEFCNYEAPYGQGCDGKILDAAGQCQEIPWGCTDDWMPVCGCNKTTYSNRCDANAAGVSVLHEGMCSVTECESIGGDPRYSDGASIPTCSDKEEDHGPFGGPNGEIPFEPTRCCVPAS